MIAIDIGGTNTRIGLFPSLDAPDYTLLAKFPTQRVGAGTHPSCPRPGNERGLCTLFFILFCP